MSHPIWNFVAFNRSELQNITKTYCTPHTISTNLFFLSFLHRLIFDKNSWLLCLVLIHIKRLFLHLFFLLIQSGVSFRLFSYFSGFFGGCYFGVCVCVRKSLFGGFGLNLLFVGDFCWNIVICKDLKIFITCLLGLNFCEILWNKKYINFFWFWPTVF